MAPQQPGFQILARCSRCNGLFLGEQTMRDHLHTAHNVDRGILMDLTTEGPAYGRPDWRSIPPTDEDVAAVARAGVAEQMASRGDASNTQTAMLSGGVQHQPVLPGPSRNEAGDPRVPSMPQSTHAAHGYNRWTAPAPTNVREAAHSINPTTMPNNSAKVGRGGPPTQSGVTPVAQDIIDISKIVHSCCAQGRHYPSGPKLARELGEHFRTSGVLKAKSGLRDWAGDTRVFSKDLWDRFLAGDRPGTESTRLNKSPETARLARPAIPARDTTAPPASGSTSLTEPARYMPPALPIQYTTEPFGSWYTPPIDPMAPYHRAPIGHGNSTLSPDSISVSWHLTIHPGAAVSRAQSGAVNHDAVASSHDARRRDVWNRHGYIHVSPPQQPAQAATGVVVPAIEPLVSEGERGAREQVIAEAQWGQAGFRRILRSMLPSSQHPAYRIFATGSASLQDLVDTINSQVKYRQCIFGLDVARAISEILSREENAPIRLQGDRVVLVGGGDQQAEPATNTPSGGTDVQTAADRPTDDDGDDYDELYDLSDNDKKSKKRKRPSDRAGPEPKCKRG